MSKNRRITRFFKPSPDDPSSSGPLGEGEWDLRLPPRIFATDRYPDARLNVYSRPDILTVVCQVLRGTPEFDKILNSSLGSLFRLRISECPMSCKLVHALLCRQVLSKKKYELWTVFGGYPLRFSLVEFGAVTGLSCAEFPEDYDHDFEPSPDSTDSSFWDELIGPNRKTTLADVSKIFEDPAMTDPEKRLWLALILIVDGVLIASSQTHKPTFKYVEMLRDIDSFLSFPWGRESFLKTISTMRPEIKNNGQPLSKKPRVQGKLNTPLQTFTDQLQQKSFRLQGFPLSLHLLAYRNISGLLDKVPGSADPRTFLDWYSVGIPKNNIPLTDVLVIDQSPMLTVSPFIHIEPPEEGWGEWDDEVKDKRISFMVSQIEQTHIFTKNEWPGGDCSLPLMSVSDQKDNVTHMKHVVPMRKQVSGKLRVNTKKDKSSEEKEEASINPNPESPSLSSVATEKAFQDLKVSVEGEIQSIRREYDTMFKKLSAQNKKLENQLKSLRFLRYRRHRIRRTSRLTNNPGVVSKAPVSTSTLPVDEVNVRTPSPTHTKSPSQPLGSPADIFESNHNWDMYVEPLKPFCSPSPVDATKKNSGSSPNISSEPICEKVESSQCRTSNSVNPIYDTETKVMHTSTFYY
ncbi:hypothetical protein CARUB_v10008573mg [Capsella rubella]|uniref:DUF1985 domain-containing protein n=1 Tax=Capsella rubella TaxID=81985 RepID=R0IBN9_9BRAS|nr:hypothetical protein CARUB_v10008573mg [Capsella rubella]